MATTLPKGPPHSDRRDNAQLGIFDAAAGADALALGPFDLGRANAAAGLASVPGAGAPEPRACEASVAHALGGGIDPARRVAARAVDVDLKVVRGDLAERREGKVMQQYGGKSTNAPLASLLA